MNNQCQVIDEIYDEKISIISGARILLVEDNEIIQDVAKSIIEEAGISVDIASNGIEAISKITKDNANDISNQLFDAVLMDIHMPEMGGIEATKAIRDWEEHTQQKNSMPIIAMTAHDMPGDKEKSIAAGMNDHITKPISPEKLYSALLTWVHPQKKQQIISILQNTEERISSQIKQQNLLEHIEIPGIDVKGAIKKLGGRTETFIKIILKFSSSKEQAINEIRTSLLENNKKNAYLLTHALKGVVANIGATELHSMLTKLETLLKQQELPKNGDNEIAQLISTLDKHMLQLLLDISDFNKQLKINNITVE